MTAKRETYEVFRYRVVYPGGTYIRISPATDAEKTGTILEFGTIFDASKSLFLDGINYAKLKDGSGWVFERKNEVQILELIQIIRVPCKKPIEGIQGVQGNEGSPVKNVPIGTASFPAPLAGNRAGEAETSIHRPVRDMKSEDSPPNVLPPPLGLLPAQIPAQRQQAKVENRLWRDVRARCGACASFEEFMLLVAALKIQGLESGSRVPIKIGMESPRGGQGMEGRGMEGITQAQPAQHEQRVLNSINLIASITKQCSSQVHQRASVVEVGTCLWVLVHMGSRVAHTMALIVESANQTFEAASSSKKAHLLRVVLEVGNRTKSHAADLARQVDILPDDIRNFLQRWIIVQSFEEEKEPPPPEEDPKARDSRLKGAHYDSCTHDSTDDSTHGSTQGSAHSSKYGSTYGSYGSKYEAYGSTYDRKSGDYRVQNTPVAETRPTSWSLSAAFAASFSSSPSSSSSWLSCPSSSLPLFLPDCKAAGRTGSDIDSSDLDHTHKHDPLAMKMKESPSRGRAPQATLERDRGGVSVSGMVWRELVKQAEKFADTDMQLAGLI